MEKYKLILVGLSYCGGCADDDEASFMFETIEDTFEKARFFLEQGYTIEIQNILEDE